MKIDGVAIFYAVCAFICAFIAMLIPAGEIEEEEIIEEAEEEIIEEYEEEDFV